MSDCRVPMPVYEKGGHGLKPCPYCHDGKPIETEVDGEGYMAVTVHDDEHFGSSASLDVYLHRVKSPGGREWVGSYGIANCPMCGRKIGNLPE